MKLDEIQVNEFSSIADKVVSMDTGTDTDMFQPIRFSKMMSKIGLI